MLPAQKDLTTGEQLVLLKSDTASVMNSRNKHYRTKHNGQKRDGQATILVGVHIAPEHHIELQLYLEQLRLRTQMV